MVCTTHPQGDQVDLRLCVTHRFVSHSRESNHNEHRPVHPRFFRCVAPECMAAEPKGIGKRAIDPDYESHILRSDVKRLCAELKESRAELKEAHAELSDGHMVRYDLEEAQNDLVRVRKQLNNDAGFASIATSSSTTVLPRPTVAAIDCRVQKQWMTINTCRRDSACMQFECQR